MRVNLSGDSTGGGGPTPEVHEQNPVHVSHAPPPVAPTPAAPAAPAAPPAAAAVINGEVTEETLRLREENEALRRTVKDRELTICENQDKHEAYRKTVEAGQPIPVKKSRAGIGMFRRSE